MSNPPLHHPHPSTVALQKRYRRMSSLFCAQPDTYVGLTFFGYVLSTLDHIVSGKGDGG